MRDHGYRDESPAVGEQGGRTPDGRHRREAASRADVEEQRAERGERWAATGARAEAGTDQGRSPGQPEQEPQSDREATWVSQTYVTKVCGEEVQSDSTSECRHGLTGQGARTDNKPEARAQVSKEDLLARNAQIVREHDEERLSWDEIRERHGLRAGTPGTAAESREQPVAADLPPHRGRLHHRCDHPGRGNRPAGVRRGVQAGAPAARGMGTRT